MLSLLGMCTARQAELKPCTVNTPTKHHDFCKLQHDSQVLPQAAKLCVCARHFADAYTPDSDACTDLSERWCRTQCMFPRCIAQGACRLHAGSTAGVTAARRAARPLADRQTPFAFGLGCPLTGLGAPRGGIYATLVWAIFWIASLLAP